MPTDTATSRDRLVALARAGDQAARGRLLDGYREFLRLLARVQIDRQLQVKVGESDVVQETFLEAHRDFGQFRGTTAAELAAWLRQILARNLANEVRRYRGTRRRDVRLERSLAITLDESSEYLGAQFAARSHTPSQAADRHEATRALADALALLPADYREVLILRNLEELTFPEVAARMGRTVDSVKKLWARGLAQLRKHLPEAAT